MRMVAGNWWRGLTMAALVLLAAGQLGGCATSVARKDPIEGFNRAVFAFNDSLDALVIRPVAKGYEFVLPDMVRTGVSNFFGNVADVFIAVNNLLQGKPAEAASDAGRFLVNSTIGILGLFDVASDMGLEKHDEDFGQTFGNWGAEPGPYLVVPVFGPRDVRDAFGLAFDLATDPIANIDQVAPRNALTALRLVSDRAALLPADKIIEEAALDKYAYLRDAYLQRRLSQIYDGRPPREPDIE